MNEDAKVIHCAGCGAPLDVAINRAYIFCKYCGCKNIIEEEKMKANINVGGRASISANTDMESLFNTIDYLISNQKYDQAEEYMTALFVTGCSDCRIYVYKIMLVLNVIKQEDVADEDEGLSLWVYGKLAKAFEKNSPAIFENLNKLRAMEAAQQGREVTDAICRLMQYQSHIGLTILHIAAFYQLYDWVVYCVEHGANVNACCVGYRGKRNFTPINTLNIGDNSSSKKLTMPDGNTPFTGDPKTSEQVRQYLKNHGGTAHSLMKHFFGK